MILVTLSDKEDNPLTNFVVEKLKAAARGNHFHPLSLILLLSREMIESSYRCLNGVRNSIAVIQQVTGQIVLKPETFERLMELDFLDIMRKLNMAATLMNELRTRRIGVFVDSTEALLGMQALISESRCRASLPEGNALESDVWQDENDKTRQTIASLGSDIKTIRREAEFFEK